MEKNVFLLILAFLALAVFPTLSQAQVTGPNPILFINKHNGFQPGIGVLPVEDGDLIGRLQLKGWVPNDTYYVGAELRSDVTGPVLNDGYPANLQLRTGYPLLTRLTVTAEGRVGIGTMLPDFDLHTVGNTHTSGDFYGRIHFDDNQGSDDAPNTYLDEAYFELKQRNVLGLPAGLGAHGGLLSLAPGASSFDHQLFFAEDGIFTRRWDGEAGSWAGATWYKLLTGEDINGTPNRIAKFVGPNSLGDSQLWDDGTQVGIGTTNPGAGYLLDINGATRVGGALVATDNTTVSGGNLTVSPDGGTGGDLDVMGSAHVDGILTIGTTNTPASLGPIPTSGYRLFVEGGMLTDEVLVRTGWADHVFESGYPLRDLAEVKQYIEENGHLPDTPSAAEIEANGLPLSAATVNQQVKIEELFLYLIQMKEDLQELKAENAELRAQVERLSAKQ